MVQHLNYPRINSFFAVTANLKKKIAFSPANLAVYMKNPSPLHTARSAGQEGEIIS